MTREQRGHLFLLLCLCDLGQRDEETLMRRERTYPSEHRQAAALELRRREALDA